MMCNQEQGYYQPQHETGPLSHRNDPATSHHAEALMRETGALSSNNKRVAWLVARLPDRTASELTEAAVHYFQVFKDMGYDKALIEVRRRLSCMKGKHVEQGKAREALLTGPEVTWRVR